MTGTQLEQLTSGLGAVAALVREDAPIMYLDVAFDVEAIQAGWPEFESRFTSLRGRKMMAVVLPEKEIYRLATVMRDGCTGTSGRRSRSYAAWGSTTRGVRASRSTSPRRPSTASCP
jgi:hypothetical protein